MYSFKSVSCQDVYQDYIIGQAGPVLNVNQRLRGTLDWLTFFFSSPIYIRFEIVLIYFQDDASRIEFPD